MPGKLRIPCPRGYASDGTDAGKLLRLLGAKNFRTLQKFFGGRRIWVPKSGKVPTCGTCRQRDACICLWRAEGRSVPSIARRLSISPKSVYRILQKKRRHAVVDAKPSRRHLLSATTQTRTKI